MLSDLKTRIDHFDHEEESEDFRIERSVIRRIGAGLEKRFSELELCIQEQFKFFSHQNLNHTFTFSAVPYMLVSHRVSKYHGHMAVGLNIIIGT